MEKLQFSAGGYEGPLDLILSLIQKHKLNICDIEISALLEQYLLAIEEMREARLEIASEFLEMASQLVYIKTAMLLPRHREEEEDPRRELTGALLEYQACKEAALRLQARSVGVDRFVRPPVEIQEDQAYARQHEPEELLEAYYAAMGRGKRRLPPPSSAFSGIVAHRVVSVSSRIVYVLSHLYRSARVGFMSLFLDSRDRPELVATFLAVLELIRDQRVRLSEDSRELVMVRANTDETQQDVDTDAI